MAAGESVPEGAAATVHGAVDTGDGELDRISELPDDILLDILGRLAAAGDHRAVARTSALSRRWRSLPWPQIRTVALDVGAPCAAGAGAASASSTAPRRGSLAPAPPGGGGGWVIETLSLKLILTRRDYLRRIGELVGGAGGAGTVRRVELDVATETECLPLDDTRAMLGYGERFVHFAGDCPGAFRSLAKLTLRSLWFHGDGAAALGELVRGCDALEFLCLKDCGLLPDGATEIAGDGPPPCALAIDAPRSRLRALLCDFCYVGRLELVHAPALAFVQYRAVFLEDSRPILFRRTPSLRAVYLCYGQLEEDDDVKLELSDLLVNVHQLEWLTLSFDICKIWLQLEHPKRLRPVLGRLRQLNLKNTHPDCDLSWAIFLLEAAPLLLTLDFHDIQSSMQFLLA
ncbi:hypothetical protein ACP4OV_000126 [Aristida adscensionis]